MGEVVHVFVCQVHRFPMKELEEAEAVEDKGLDGCIHGRRGSKRQVLLMDCETLERICVSPGAVKENITTRGIDFQALGEGQRLRIGQGLFEIISACHPCDRMDEIQQGLREELRGQRGWLCRIVGSGRVRRGDRIEVLGPVAKVSK